MKDAMKDLWIVYPLCSIFMIVGAGAAFYGIRGMVKQRAIDKWPAVDAKLFMCQFETYPALGEPPEYEVLVQYEYTVAGKKYSSNKIHPSYSASRSEAHAPLYEKLKKSSVVRARYNEVAPEESYIVTGRFPSALLNVLGGMLFFSLGLCVLLFFRVGITGHANYAVGVDVVRERAHDPPN